MSSSLQMCRVILSSLFILTTLESVYLLPASSGVSGKAQNNVVSFMMRYGYLEPKSPILGEYRTEAEMIRGIKQMQEFAGLKGTGVIDEETVKLISTPRCSLPDVGPGDRMRRRKRYALHDTIWRKTDLTYKVTNKPKTELSMNEVIATVRKAFDLWSAVSPLKFTDLSSPYYANREVDIEMSFERASHGDGYPFDGRGDRIAHAFYPLSNKGKDGDVHFDDDEHWTLNKPGDDSTDFFWTAVHEIGHALGIQHSWYRSAVMYPYYTGFKPNLKLNEDDVMAIQAKYGRKPTTPSSLPPSSKSSGPSPCDKTFDAVVHSGDGNTYFFKDHIFWTLDKFNRSLGGGRNIVDFWPNLRRRVHAAYTRRDGKTVFFKGKRFWVYEGMKHVEGPKDIKEYGLPIHLKRIDAAFTWGANGHTYFFKGHRYWRYNEKMKRIDPGYPRDISKAWGAVSYPVDAAMRGGDGNTYFFKGEQFQIFDLRKYSLSEPQKTGDYFFRCNDFETLPTTGPYVEAVLKTNNDDENNNGSNDANDGNNGVRTTLGLPLILLITISVSFFNL